jgi:GDP-L-fucose synthase|tara:strand:- start:882 stop:1823 length:942 start_codon:yes stop_codon:yes gene_type:complete
MILKMINKNSKIFLAGHNGMVGSAILNKLKKLNFKRLYVIERAQLDLRNQSQVYKYINKIKPDAVILAAAKVGGILSNNTYRGEFIYDNLSIQNNVIHGSYLSGVKNLIFLGSSCIYPKNSKQPIKEKYLLSNYLEKTNEPYAIAKIAGINLCESYSKQYKLNYKSLMPCNAYGPNDNYEPISSHFFAALIRKIINSTKENKSYIEVWGTGKPLRELIFADDVADACIFFLGKKNTESIINIGSGVEYTIEDYAKKIMKHLNVKLKIRYHKKKLNGTKRKLLDSSMAKKLGWKSKTTLEQGLEITIKDYLKKI